MGDGPYAEPPPKSCRQPGSPSNYGNMPFQTGDSDSYNKVCAAPVSGTFFRVLLALTQCNDHGLVIEITNSSRED